MRRQRRPAPHRLPRGAVAVDAVIHDDGVWQLVRGRLTHTGEPVSARRPCQPSARAVALLAAELRLLTAVGGGPLPAVIGMVDGDTDDATLVWRPAIVTSLADLLPSAVAPPGGPPTADGDRIDEPDETDEPHQTGDNGEADEARPGLDAAQVAGVVGRLADALASLHGAGFVHAGIEPAAVAVDGDGWAVLASVGSARRAGSGRAQPADDVAALGRLGLDLLAPDGRGCSARGGDADADAVRAVLGRLVDPDPGRRPDARTAADVLRRAGPIPRPVSIPVETTTPPAVSPGAHRLGSRLVTGAEPIPSGPSEPTDPFDRFDRMVPPVPSDPRGSTSPSDPASPVGPSAAGHEHDDPARRPGSDRPAAPRTGRRGTVPGRHRSSVLAAAGAALLVVGIARLHADEAVTTHPPAACPVAGAPAEASGTVTVQADVDGRGCTVAVRWQPERGQVEIVAPEGVRRYGLGQAGDELVVADWDCDGAATPMLRRPATAEAWRFDRWPTDAQPVEPIPVVADLAPPTC